VLKFLGLAATAILWIGYLGISVVSFASGIIFFGAHGHNLLISIIFAALVGSIPIINSFASAYFLSWYFSWPYVLALALLVSPYAMGIAAAGISSYFESRQRARE